jgi:hypothetical protein
MKSSIDELKPMTLRLTTSERLRLEEALLKARRKTGEFVAIQALIREALAITDVDALAMQLAVQKGAK